MAQLVDGLVGNPHDVQVDDRPAVRAVDDVDDASQEGLYGVQQLTYGGMRRGTMMVGFSESPEFRDRSGLA